MATVVDQTERALSQRFAALGNANQVRSLRKELKADLSSGARDLADVIGEPEWWLFSLQVHELLSWGRRMGRWHVSQALKQADVWPLRLVGDLSVRQRQNLAAHLHRGLVDPPFTVYASWDSSE